MVALVGYGLTLTVASDTVYLLAIPGVLCLIVVVFVSVRSFLRRPFHVPTGFEELDQRRVVRRHRAVLLQRYAMLLAGAAALCVMPFWADVAVLYPLVGVGVGIVKLSLCSFVPQLAFLKRCSRVLSVYEPEFRAPVRLVMGRGNGELCVRVGEGEHSTPTMVARSTVDYHELPAGLADGGWFAGDTALGGVLPFPEPARSCVFSPRTSGPARTNVAARAPKDEPRPSARDWMTCTVLRAREVCLPVASTVATGFRRRGERTRWKRARNPRISVPAQDRGRKDTSLGSLPPDVGAT